MRKKLAESNILIAGLARNCSGVIYSEVLKISNAFSGAKSVRWLIIESDSTDNTVDVLKSMDKKLSLRYISLGKLREILNKRTERIAKCRNKYVQEIRDNVEYLHTDYVVVADLDGVNCKLKPESVNSCWEMEEDWDACFANQTKGYYDIWALRHNTWSPNDCWNSFNFLIQNGANHFDALHASVYSKMIVVEESNKPIKVESAFGGLGIYKKSLFLESNYCGLNADGLEKCEHVSFHKALNAKGYKFYINPKLINCHWNQHNKNLKFSSKVISRLRYFTIKFITKFISKEMLKKIFKREA